MRTSPFSRHKKQLNASMNVVPYIDVMLVLLVIFMVTTPMLTTGINVDLPKAQTENIGTGSQMPVIVSLMNNGEIFVSYENNIDMPVSEAELIDTLIRLQSQAPDDAVKVMINADQNNQYGMIMQLMANLQQAGVEKVGLLTGQPLDTATP
ncbi:protein TolR [Psychrobacter sp. FDAARGOS_221]|uniref:protein TolR n=1 Tax=Psychrobacter sp. FDAARGOS_221 TaxID=1975705 RepID=UPI000BB543A0|nr:protein TolR [Psychrobacter sp. FDAARGOS_221]PNK59885.1 protein TolR [Psychrobacter sp. FDAARGOS_221]